jgi:hypothetical protein
LLENDPLAKARGSVIFIDLNCLKMTWLSQTIPVFLSCCSRLSADIPQHLVVNGSTGIQAKRVTVGGAAPAFDDVIIDKRRGRPTGRTRVQRYYVRILPEAKSNDESGVETPSLPLCMV